MYIKDHDKRRSILFLEPGTFGEKKTLQQKTFLNSSLQHACATPGLRHHCFMPWPQPLFVSSFLYSKVQSLRSFVVETSAAGKRVFVCKGILEEPHNVF
ncbi:hypothetical protein CEXT_40771 [Caerostris extrusa]|uniref:Uncharacterized protein n=1 Tax=Caerostris extrusa TaxID=172846 RepID=A0AAV4Y4L2_CAEEX|nr:hypothetical protein CEXT_40771 [Caerostris extrusa]